MKDRQEDIKVPKILHGIFQKFNRYKTVPSYPMLIFLSEVQGIGASSAEKYTCTAKEGEAITANSKEALPSFL